MSSDTGPLQMAQAHIIADLKHKLDQAEQRLHQVSDLAMAQSLMFELVRSGVRSIDDPLVTKIFGMQYELETAPIIRGAETQEAAIKRG